MAPEQRAHLRIAIQHGEQRVAVTHADRVHPGAADGHRVVVETDQHMALTGGIQGLFQQGQLLGGEMPGHGAGDGGVQQHQSPVGEIDDGLECSGAGADVAHHRNLVVVTGEPAGRRRNALDQLAEMLVGGGRTVLGEIAGRQHQVDARLLVEHPVDHPLQAVVGFHAQQLAVRLGEQVAVGELHQQHRLVSGVGEWTGQGLLLGRNAQIMVAARATGKPAKREWFTVSGAGLVRRD
ncbi:hypothetical protein D3C81_1435230 [compost metagenome]